MADALEPGVEIAYGRPCPQRAEIFQQVDSEHRN